MLIQEWLIKTAKKTVPSFRWVIGAASLLALAGIVIKWGFNLATIFLVAGMLLVFAMAFIALNWITKLKPDKSTRMAALTAWSLLSFLIAALALVLSSVAIDKPWHMCSWIERQLGIKREAEPVERINSPQNNDLYKSQMVGGLAGANERSVQLAPGEHFTNVTVHWRMGDDEHRRSSVDGIELQTSSGKTLMLGTTQGFGQLPDETHHDSFSLFKDQYLTSIAVQVGDFHDKPANKVITGITFTIRNQDGTDSSKHFGKETAKIIAAEPGREIMGFRGRYGFVLDSIGIITRVRTE